MLLAEEVVATGNPKQLDAAALQRLSGDLSPMCQEHIARACAAQAHLAQPIVEPKSVVDARAVMVAATAEAQRRADAEIQAVGEANAKCPSGSKDCEARCENGEPAFCLAWASWLVAAKPPRLVEAKTYFRKACDGGVRMGCALFNDADRRIQQAAAETEQWWERVEQAGDRLVRIPAGADHIADYGQGPAALTRMHRMVGVVTREAYCPARAEFIASTNEAEFSKRVTDHCATGAPPEGCGPDACVQRCRAAYAAPCPGGPPRRFVAPTIDNMAINRFKLASALEVEVHPTLSAHAMLLARQLEASQVTQYLCPARKTFLSQFSTAQLKKAALDHCQGDPPLGHGLSGAEVPLSSECQAILALPCP
jgi:hypothetical protein